jgi:hypothetical protein
LKEESISGKITQQQKEKITILTEQISKKRKTSKTPEKKKSSKQVKGK